MDAKRGNLWLAASWAWLLLLFAYFIWGLVGERGLYGWLVDWQVQRWGYYHPALTGGIPILLLGAPALWYIRRRDAERRALEAAQGPAGEARRFGRNARTFSLAGLVCLAVAAGAVMLSRSAPDAYAPPVPFDAATLGAGPVPEGRVQVRGEIDPDAGTGVVESGRSLDRTTYYVGFRPDGAPKDAPLALFIARSAGSGADPATAQGFYPEQDGWLVENGLPPLARRDLESRGIGIADPHWVLDPGGGATPRDTYYIIAFVAGLVGFALLVAGFAAFLQARRRLRAAHPA
jgi:hypothetical protein